MTKLARSDELKVNQCQIQSSNTVIQGFSLEEYDQP